MSVDHDYAFVTSAGKTVVGQTANVAVRGGAVVSRPVVTGPDGRPLLLAQRAGTASSGMIIQGQPNSHHMRIPLNGGVPHGDGGSGNVRQIAVGQQRIVTQGNTRVITTTAGGPGQVPRGTQYVVVSSASHVPGTGPYLARPQATVRPQPVQYVVQQQQPQPQQVQQGGQQFQQRQGAPHQQGIITNQQIPRHQMSNIVNYPSNQQQVRVQHVVQQQQQQNPVVYAQQPQIQGGQQHQQVQQIQKRQYAQPPPQQMVRQVQYVPTDPNSVNLTNVPIREPSPEPVQKFEIKEEPQESSSNQEPMPTEEDGEIDIQIRNVVCNYTLPLHIDLRKLAMNSNNVTYDRGRGVMMKQKRNPNCYIKVYSSGKVYIVGCRSEDDCMRASRSIARHVQRVMGKKDEKISMRNYRVNNVLATCRMPFGIKIEELAQKYPVQSQYEPELSVGLIWKSTDPKATLRIHTTGSITVTGANSEADVMTVIENIWPIVIEFRCADRAKKSAARKQKRKRAAPAGPSSRPPVKRERFDDGYGFGSSGVVNNKVYFSDEDDIYEEDDLDDM